MECLHAIRFFTKLMGLDLKITMDGWAEIYSQLQNNPHWRCGCPNQEMNPEWERWRAWIREQMGEDNLEDT